MVSKGLVVTSLVILALGYWLYTPLPEGISEPWKLRIIMANLKIIKAFVTVGVTLGLDSELNLMRSITEKFLSMNARDERIVATDTRFDGVKVRIYRPKAEPNTILPALVYYHGGGWVLLSVNAYDSLTSYIAAEANIVVVSVDYRLAPEHPFPVPFDDCVTATVHLLRNAKNYKVDPRRIGIGGDSAGGNLAAAVALKLRDRKSDVQPKIQALLYPVLQSFDVSLPSRLHKRGLANLLLNHGVSVSRYLGLPSVFANAINNNTHISSSLRKEYAQHLNYKLLPDGFIPAGHKPSWSKSESFEGNLPAPIQKMFTNRYFAPLLAKDLRSLPTAYVFTVDMDPLRDEGFLYKKRLEEAGVKTTYVHFPDTYHGVLNGQTQTAKRSVHALVKFLDENL